MYLVHYSMEKHSTLLLTEMVALLGIFNDQHGCSLYVYIYNIYVIYGHIYV